MGTLDYVATVFVVLSLMIMLIYGVVLSLTYDDDTLKPTLSALTLEMYEHRSVEELSALSESQNARFGYSVKYLMQTVEEARPARNSANSVITAAATAYLITPTRPRPTGTPQGALAHHPSNTASQSVLIQLREWVRMARAGLIAHPEPTDLEANTDFLQRRGALLRSEAIERFTVVVAQAESLPLMKARELTDRALSREIVRLRAAGIFDNLTQAAKVAFRYFALWSLALPLASIILSAFIKAMFTRSFSMIGELATTIGLIGLILSLFASPLTVMVSAIFYSNTRPPYDASRARTTRWLLISMPPLFVLLITVWYFNAVSVAHPLWVPPSDPGGIVMRLGLGLVGLLSAWLAYASIQPAVRALSPRPRFRGGMARARRRGGRVSSRSMPQGPRKVHAGREAFVQYATSPQPWSVRLRALCTALMMGPVTLLMALLAFSGVLWPELDDGPLRNGPPEWMMLVSAVCLFVALPVCLLLAAIAGDYERRLRHRKYRAGGMVVRGYFPVWAAILAWGLAWYVVFMLIDHVALQTEPMAPAEAEAYLSENPQWFLFGMLGGLAFTVTFLILAVWIAWEINRLRKQDQRLATDARVTGL